LPKAKVSVVAGTAKAVTEESQAAAPAVPVEPSVTAAGENASVEDAFAGIDETLAEDINFDAVLENAQRELPKELSDMPNG